MVNLSEHSNGLNFCHETRPVERLGGPLESAVEALLMNLQEELLEW